MPINTEDEEFLSRSNMLLKILGLSKFPFHFRFCDAHWPLLLRTQTFSNFIFRQNSKENIFSLFMLLEKWFWGGIRIFYTDCAQTCTGLFSQGAGEIHHMIITLFSADMIGEMLSPHSE